MFNGMGKTPFFSSRDTLTGRPDRTALLDHLDKRSAENLSTSSGWGYLTVGIDRMAFINDALGIPGGDSVICGVGERLEGLSPVGSIVARVGGNTFGILIPALASKNLETFAESLLRTFRERPVTTTRVSLHITVSIGSVHPCDLAETTRAADILIHAEQALHDARHKGHNRHVAFRDPALRTDVTSTALALGERVKQALKHGTLRMAYQPVVDSKTGEPLFYEALARLFGDDGKLIPAGDFVPVVEQQGLADEFDRHVLGLVIQELAETSEVRLAVNISGETAMNPRAPALFHDVLQGRPDIARRLIVEITETVAITDVEQTQRLIQTLNQLGAEASLDDFGSGFTSIRHLRSLSLSILKVDKELLNNLLDDPEQEHLVRMILGIAKGLGIKTVVEGIETAEVAGWLQREQADMLQGYYFGRPSLNRPWVTPRRTGTPPSALTRVWASAPVHNLFPTAANVRASA